MKGMDPGPAYRADEPGSRLCYNRCMSLLNEERLEVVCRKLVETGARSVLDLGCGSGSLLRLLLAYPQFTRILGVELSGISLGAAQRELSRPLYRAEGRLELILGSYAEPDKRFSGFDAAAMVETIEHTDPSRLTLIERAVFGSARPGVVFLTTPNQEFNVLLDLQPGTFRDPDHRFEWGRAKFRSWARGVAARNSYRVGFQDIGEADAELGAPTQMAIFARLD